MNEIVNESSLRMRVGSVAAGVSVVVFVTVTIAFSLLELSFRTWSVGQYVENRTEYFFDLFVAGGVCSVITLPFSCLGRGAIRLIGIVCSIGVLTLLFFLFLQDSGSQLTPGG